MRCIRVHRARRSTPCMAAMLALGAAAHNARAQTSPPPAYRAPTIVVAAPADGTPLPEDKPVAVLRFMSSEPTDPIDALSFSVAVDGKDKTALFKATVTIVASASGLPVAAAKAESKQKKARILDAVVQAIRVLFR